MDSTKCSSNLSTASNNLFPTSLYSVPALDLSKDKASLELSSALSSHSAVSGSTSSLAFYKAANSFN